MIQELLSGLDQQMAEHDKEFDLAITTLRGMYMFSDDDEVAAFLRSNRTIAPLLIEAFPYPPPPPYRRNACSAPT